MDFGGVKRLPMNQILEHSLILLLPFGYLYLTWLFTQELYLSIAIIATGSVASLAVINIILYDIIYEKSVHKGNQKKTE